MEGDRINVIFMTNLQIRILSAVFLGSIFIASIIYTTYLYYIILGIIAIGMIYEWYRITNTKYMYVILGSDSYSYICRVYCFIANY